MHYQVQTKTAEGTFATLRRRYLTDAQLSKVSEWSQGSLPALFTPDLITPATLDAACRFLSLCEIGLYCGALDVRADDLFEGVTALVESANLIDYYERKTPRPLLTLFRYRLKSLDKNDFRGPARQRTAFEGVIRLDALSDQPHVGRFLDAMAESTGASRVSNLIHDRLRDGSMGEGADVQPIVLGFVDTLSLIDLLVDLFDQLRDDPVLRSMVWHHMASLCGFENEQVHASLALVILRVQSQAVAVIEALEGEFDSAKLSRVAMNTFEASFRNLRRLSPSMHQTVLKEEIESRRTFVLTSPQTAIARRSRHAIEDLQRYVRDPGTFEQDA